MSVGEAESAARYPTEFSLCAGAVVLVQEEHAPSCRGVRAMGRRYGCGRWWAELAVCRWPLRVAERTGLGCREMEGMSDERVGGDQPSAPLIALQLV